MPGTKATERGGKRRKNFKYEVQFFCNYKDDTCLKCKLTAPSSPFQRKETLTSRKDPNLLPNTNRIPPTPFRNMIVPTNCRICILSSKSEKVTTPELKL